MLRRSQPSRGIHRNQRCLEVFSQIDGNFQLLPLACRIQNVDDVFDGEIDDWEIRLAEGSQDRDRAILEIRAYLVRGLSVALRNRYGGTSLIEDVVQEALLKILSSLHTFQRRSRFTTWAMSIAIRIGISKLRRSYYKDISLDQTATRISFQVENVDSQTESHENKESRASMFQLLQKLIDESLSERQKLAIRGTLDGLPVEEIAVRLQSNRNAVYKLIHDARLRLRREFEAHGVKAEDITTTFP